MELPREHFAPREDDEREVMFFSRTVNEIGEVGREFFGILRDVFDHNFSTFMHWGIIVDNEHIFEMQGGSGSRPVTFEQSRLPPFGTDDMQDTKRMGTTRTTDAEILAIGRTYVECHMTDYNFFFNNCQLLTNHVLDEILVNPKVLNRKSTASGALERVGSFVSSVPSSTVLVTHPMPVSSNPIPYLVRSLARMI